MKKFVILLTFLITILESALASDYEYVDLGLSVKWANKNVGADKITDYGNHFAWAETIPKNEYNWSTYKYTVPGATRMTKYNSTTLGAVTDFLTELEPEDDAATQNMGSNWRTPNLAEMNELIEKCIWTWVNNYQGSTHSGFIVKSTVKGYTDKSIFLPAAGYYTGKNPGDINKGGMYWTSTLDTKSFAHTGAAQLYFTSGGPLTMGFDRQLGLTVRAVYGPKSTIPKDYDISGTEQGHDYVDLGLSVQWATTNIGTDNPKLGGNFYSWAEIEPKSEYKIGNYKYSINGMYDHMSKYNESDNIVLLEHVDDAASVNWGDKWRLPTSAEFEELINGCDWYWETGFVYGVSKINDNVIILSTTTGCRDNSLGHSSDYDGYYWTANRGYDQQRALACLFRRQGGYAFISKVENRYMGYTIRPVMTRILTSIDEKKLTDIDQTNDGVIIKDGRILICKDNKYYNLLGQPVR